MTSGYAACMPYFQVYCATCEKISKMRQSMIDGLQGRAKCGKCGDYWRYVDTDEVVGGERFFG